MSYFVFGSSDFTFLKIIKLNNRKLRNISKRHLPILKNIQPRGIVGYCLRVFVLQGKRDTLEKTKVLSSKEKIIIIYILVLGFTVLFGRS